MRRAKTTNACVMNFKRMKTMEKKEYMQPQIEVAKMEAGNLLDNSVNSDRVIWSPGATGPSAPGEVAGEEVNSKLNINDVWE